MKYNSKIYALFDRGDKTVLKVILKYLDLQKNDKILEIGCGRGFRLKKIQSFCPTAIGIDINPEAISNGVCPNLKLMDAMELEFPEKFFDKIYSCHTIEHIPDLKKFFRETERVLKPGGRLVLIYPWELFRGMGAIGASLIIFKNPFSFRKIHLHKLTPKKIKKIIKDTSFKVLKSEFLLFKTPQYCTVLEKEK